MAACRRGSGHKLVIDHRSCKFHNSAFRTNHQLKADLGLIRL